ncbi:MAG: hypothetical protein BCS36_08260 [Desulfovibrio sp. MES5]|nr:hypothetical protein [Desulfovibrio sp. MES5]OXS28768.1 MAG: hypothetical protein BCS36_08260 [Desulfovibrio sp. MES5]
MRFVKITRYCVVTWLRSKTLARTPVTIREFDVICPPDAEVWRCGHQTPAEALKFSQPILALPLHTLASTVRKWEQGEAHPIDQRSSC